MSKPQSTTTYTNTKELIAQAENALVEQFKHVDDIAEKNFRKVMEAFHQFRLADEHFIDKTGYGRDDPARETIDQIYAHIFRAESAAVRVQFVSGTHALACALFGSVKPKERLACITGLPYDTLQEVIGIAEGGEGSLKDLGVDYIQGDVRPYLNNIDDLKKALAPLVSSPTTCVYIQKSCGYTYGAKTLSNKQIQTICTTIKSINSKCRILVDNCYGEFAEEVEPIEVGADLIAGSLIKNPGSGLAITGGYIAGKKHLVESALNKLTAPGIGGHLGLTFNQNRLILQGLFLAPQVVSNAIKGAMLFAYVFTELGFQVSPLPFDLRSDIIQSIKLGDPERLISFCRAIQKLSPVNSYVLPEPALMPGYQHKIIMAGGSFVEGSTIELSADGPLREPYAVFIQGGLTYLHVKYVLEESIKLLQSES